MIQALLQWYITLVFEFDRPIGYVALTNRKTSLTVTIDTPYLFILKMRSLFCLGSRRVQPIGARRKREQIIRTKYVLFNMGLGCYASTRYAHTILHRDHGISCFGICVLLVYTLVTSTTRIAYAKCLSLNYNTV